MPSSIGGIAKTHRSGRGSSASCSTWPQPWSRAPPSTSFTTRPSTRRCLWRSAACRQRLCCRRSTICRRLPEIALWSRYRDAPFVAVSHHQARALAGLSVFAVIPHAIDTAAYPFRSTPDDYLLFLGRFSEGKGVLQAIEAARRTRMRLILAAAENEYYREVIAPLVDQDQIVYAGEVGHTEKAALLGGARALLYPVQSGEPFGLVMAEAMACGTPVAALDRGAVREVVDEGTTGRVFDSLDALVEGLPSVLALDRAVVRARAMERFNPDRMVDAYLGVYARLAASRSSARAAERPAMKAEHDDLRARSLLAVFAHPDDESLACGGLLAWCAHLGARVSVCCATAGELGPRTSRCSQRPPSGTAERRAYPRRDRSGAARLRGRHAALD